MSQNSSPATLAALGQPVSVEGIESALKKLWEDDQASTKASLVNFAILSEDRGTLERNTRWIQRITSENACRALLVDANFSEDVEPSIEAWVTAHCHLQGGQHSVCSEQISFRLHGRMVGRMRNVIFAHLVSDLPLIFWWQGSIAKSVAFERHIYKQIDRLFIDSASWGTGSQLATEIERLSALIEEREQQIVVNDLSWTRILPFRKGIVALFDDPRMTAHLGGLDKLTIHGNLEAPGTIICFASWISSSLQWKLVSATSDRFGFEDQEGNPRQIQLVAAENGESIDAVEWTGDAGSIKIVFTDEHRNYVSVDSKFNNVDDRNLVPAGKTDCADLVMTQLARATRDEIYRGVLPEFRKLAAASTK